MLTSGSGKFCRGFRTFPALFYLERIYVQSTFFPSIVSYEPPCLWEKKQVIGIGIFFLPFRPKNRFGFFFPSSNIFLNMSLATSYICSCSFCTTGTVVVPDFFFLLNITSANTCSCCFIVALKNVFSYCPIFYSKTLLIYFLSYFPFSPPLKIMLRGEFL